MRYALIREMDISNGNGVGVSLFVQGCHFNCKGCFNQETWDFNGGKEWTEETKNKFIKLIDKPYVKRVSILGGEPLANENRFVILDLIKEIKIKFPQKRIWLYTGYTFEELCDEYIHECTYNHLLLNIWKSDANWNNIQYIDILVDGRFNYDLQDINDKKNKFVGSSNQRVIDIQESLQRGEIVLYEQSK